MKNALFVLFLFAIPFTSASAQPFVFYTKPETKTCDWLLFDVATKQKRILASTKGTCSLTMVWDQNKQATYFTKHGKLFSFSWKTPSQIQDLGDLPIPENKIIRFLIGKNGHLRIAHTLFAEIEEDEEDSPQKNERKNQIVVSDKTVSYQGKTYPLPQIPHLETETECSGIAMIEEYQKGKWVRLATKGTSTCLVNDEFFKNNYTEGAVYEEQKHRADGLYVHKTLLQPLKNTWNPKDSFGKFTWDQSSDKRQVPYFIDLLKLSQKIWIIYKNYNWLSESDRQIAPPIILCQLKSECTSNHLSEYEEDVYCDQKKLCAQKVQLQAYNENDQVEVVPNKQYSLLRKTNGNHFVLLQNESIEPVFEESKAKFSSFLPFPQVWNSARPLAH